MPSTAVKLLPAVPGNHRQVTTATELNLEVVRVRESEIDANLFDSTTGEYFAPPPAPARNQKKAADRWVKSELAAVSS